MRRCPFARFLLGLTALVAPATGCFDISSSGLPLLTLSPILDSMFVGDTLDSLTVRYYDANLNPQPTGPVTWSIRPDSVAQIDATGRIVALKRGTALAIAQARGIATAALLVVSRRLDLTLLLDTVYVMPGDTITLPLAILQKPPAPFYTKWFDPSPDPARYTIDTATGLVTAVDSGNSLVYVAHAAAGSDTVADTGAVRVMTLSGTAGGRGLFTVLGTAIRHSDGPAGASHYVRRDGAFAFRLVDSLGGSDSDRVVITLRDSITGIGTFPIDSLSPGEGASGFSAVVAVCQPPRPWALWSAPALGIQAFSQLPIGQLTVTQYATIPGGHVISGRYLFRAQRTDFYFDPLGALTVRGTFVAPLISHTGPCQL
jgi:hypothetical protein